MLGLLYPRNKLAPGSIGIPEEVLVPAVIVEGPTYIVCVLVSLAWIIIPCLAVVEVDVSIAAVLSTSSLAPVTMTPLANKLTSILSIGKLLLYAS